MEKGRAAPRVADDEDGRRYLFLPVSSKEDVVQEKTEPDRELEQGEDEVEGDKNPYAPRCPSAVRQPEVGESEKGSEVESHLLESHGGRASGERLKKAIRY
jgi:hypothetical protein